LISRVKEFSGAKGENLENFFYTIERYFKNDDVPEENKVDIASDHLIKNALETYKLASQDHELTWPELKDILRRNFQASDYQASLRQELKTLRQTGNVCDYIYEFEKLMNQINGMSELDKASNFITGLQDNIAAYVTLFDKGDTLIGAKQEALRVENTFKASNSNRNNNFHQRQNDNRGTERQYDYRGNSDKYFNKDRGQNSRELQASPKSNDQVPAKNNYVIQQKNQNDYQQKPLQEQKPKLCFKCNEPYFQGHREVCSKKEANPRNTYQKSANINVIEEVKAKGEFHDLLVNVTKSLLKCQIWVGDIPLEYVIDSGATKSVISAHIVKKHHIPLSLDSKTQVSLANGVKVPASITMPLSVCIQNRYCKMSFLVLPHDSIEVIIGLDLLTHMRATLDLCTHVLKFPSESLVLKEDENGSVEYDIAISELCDEEEFQEEMTWDLKGSEKGIDIIKKQYDPRQGDNEDYIRLWQLILSYEDLFAADNMSLGTCTLEPITINTRDTKPIFQYAYRKSLKERETIKNEVQEMLNAGIIRESRSPWASPVVLIPKKDGSKRFCVDSRKLNAQSINDAYPLPRVSDILDRLQGSVWFSTIDMKAGFWQISMAPESIAKTAFITPDGLYEFVKAPFGLKNLPAEFSRRMRQALGDLPYVEIYLDDVTVHSKGYKEHIQHLEIVLERFRQVGLKLNPKKCVFLARSVHLLGHVISADGVAMDPAKIETIKNMKYCKNVKHVQQFLGLCGYYRRFVKDFAKIAYPLNHLIKKDTVWKFDDECIKAFETLRAALMEQPILRQADFSKSFTLYTDTSGFCIGAILSQVDDKGAEYVCEYASRLLKAPEVNYTVSEKECLGVLWGCQHFRVYLHGTRFRIVSDHKALNWLMSITDHTGRLARWSLYLTPYDFEIVHRKGTAHQNVDTLSRPVMFVNAVNLITEITEADLAPVPIIQEPENSLERQHDIYEDEYALHYLKYGRPQVGSSNNQVRRVEKIAKSYKMVDNVIYYNYQDTWLLVPPMSERQNIVVRCHLIGHFGEKTTLERVKEKYFWRGAHLDVERVVSKCIACIRHGKRPPMHHPAQALRINKIFDRWGLDLVHGLPETKRGNKSVIVFTEYLSKWPYAAAIPNKSAETVAPHLRNVIFTFGPMKELLTDQGREWVNATFEMMCKNTGVEHRVTSPYRPQCNGQCEKLNFTLIQCIKKHAEKNPEDWDLWIPYVLMAYRTRPQVSLHTN
jgi:hypothetical protein